jgi:uncharacterized small protein (DUF1192 family)
VELDAKIAECEWLAAEVTDRLALLLIQDEIELANAEKARLHPGRSGRTL